MKKTHQADKHDRAAIAEAVRFVASIFIGTGRYAKRETASLSEARVAALELEDTFGGNHRKPLVYAILPAGNQVLVPPDYNPSATQQEHPIMATKSKKTAKPAAKNTPAKKAAIAKKAAAGTRPLGKRAAIEQAAKDGKLPTPPDFTAETHARFRPKLDELVKMVRAKDLKGLKAYKINPVSSSPKALDRYRNLAIIAIEAQA